MTLYDKHLRDVYPRILVDEFQDTDPLQAEILWRLAGDGEASAAWHEWALRPGALFLVGDPKQAIYRFRGADVETYLTAKRATRGAGFERRAGDYSELSAPSPACWPSSMNISRRC